MSVGDAKKRLGNETLAEDCAQETFLVLFEKLSSGNTFEDEKQLKSFLYKVNANNAEHIIRNLARITKATDALAEELDVKRSLTFEDYLIDREEKQELDNALKAIPIHHAAATIYHIGYELPYSKVADILGNTTDSIRKYTSRGIKELKDKMKD